MLRIEELKKSYSIGNETLDILKGVSFGIEKGEFVSILGPSGCGKSTLLNIIAGLDKHEEGKLYFDGNDTKAFKEKDWDQYRKEHIGFIFQNFNLLPHLTALQNVEMAMSLNAVPRNEQRKRAEELLTLVELQDRMNHKPNELSGGQKQRVAIARALANNPDILLADEPTGAVDSKTSIEIMSLLRKLNTEQGMTIIMVTHSDEMADCTDRKICMLDGIINQDIRLRNSKSVVATSKKKERTLQMSMVTAIKTALLNIKKKKGRNFLTILGTSIGIASVLVMLGLGVGAENKVYDLVSGLMGDKSIWVEYEDGSLMERADEEKIAAVDGVNNMIDSTMFSGVLLYNNQKSDVLIDSYGPQALETEYEKEIVKKGTKPSGDNADEIVISEDTAAAWIGTDADSETLIGKKVTALVSLSNYSGISYEIEKELTIVGISDNGFLGSSTCRIPYDTSIAWAKESTKQDEFQPARYEVRVDEGVDETKVANELNNAGYVATTNKDDYKQISQFLMIIRAFLVLIAGISIIVSGIMISIVLYTNVLERTKEIGTLRALGARKVDIRRIFLTEAGSLGFFAGILGTIIALGIGAIVNAVAAAIIERDVFKIFQLSMLHIVFGITFAIVVSVISGLSPAQKAAKLNVIDALRYE